MGFRNNSYAKVWKVNTGKGNYADIQLSVSEKDKRTNEYVTAFSGYVRFIGKAYNNLPAEGDKIKLVSVDLVNSYDKEKKTTYWNPKCFEWEPADNQQNASAEQQNTSTAQNTGFLQIPEGAEEELPF